MSGHMASLKKSRNRTRFPLALNPMKSKDVLAVLAERNQTIVPVGAWVEPASPGCPEIQAHTSAFMIEEQLKEQQRRKQESLKHFQRQVKHRVNQQIRLRKKQQLQKSYKAAEKEGSIVMQCSDSAHLTPKRTSVFQSNLNAAIGSSRLPPSWMLGDSVEDGENQNQNELFQQAQALSQTMKQARHQLASFKTVSEKKESVFLNGRMQSFPTQEELGYKEMSFVVTGEKEPLFGRYQQDCLSKDKDKPFSRVQSLYAKQRLCGRTTERWQEDLHLDGHQHHPSSLQRDTCSRQQVYECQLGLSTESQAPLAFQSGVDQEEDKKERQKQFLRHRRLFMDIEREQVKEQQRQREQKKKVEKIKKKKEQQRYAEEQKILRMNCHEVPDSGERMSDILAQLQLDEIQGAREKQQQKEKEYVRYVEALRAQVQEKMKLYNITLPPLCCCGPDFWDAHPDTCANNCIFYKNYRAYNRALHSVINSSDISEGTATLRNAICNFACAHKRTSKKVCNRNLKSAKTTGSISAFS